MAWRGQLGTQREYSLPKVRSNLGTHSQTLFRSTFFVLDPFTANSHGNHLRGDRACFYGKKTPGNRASANLSFPSQEVSVLVFTASLESHS